MIVLHEPRGQAGGGIAIGVVALEEEAPRIAEDARLDDQHAFQVRGDDVHGESRKLSRYVLSRIIASR